MTDAGKKNFHQPLKLRRFQTHYLKSGSGPFSMKAVLPGNWCAGQTLRTNFRSKILVPLRSKEQNDVCEALRESFCD